METKFKTIEDFKPAMIMLMSGTPDNIQCDLTKSAHFYKNVQKCECSYKEAIKEKYIVRPNLYLVKCGRVIDLPSAVLTVLESEIKICNAEKFPVRFLNCCSSIDEINELSKHKNILSKIGKEFHIINLHSDKKVRNSENEYEIISSTIDGIECDSKKVFSNYLEALDKNTAFNDTMPVLINQVDMISEGINVKSINSVMLSCKSPKKAAQQIGRAIRHWSYNGREKIKDGHANIYLFYDNKADIVTLFDNLEKEETLTSDCFQWQAIVDISNGSTIQTDDNDNVPELNNFQWNKIESKIIEEIRSGIKDTINFNEKNKRIAQLFSVDLDIDDKDGNGISDTLEEIVDSIFNNLNEEERCIFYSSSWKAPKNNSTTGKSSNSSKNTNSNITKLELYNNFIHNVFDTIKNQINNHQTIKYCYEIDYKSTIQAILVKYPEFVEYLLQHCSKENIDKCL